MRCQYCDRPLSLLSRRHPQRLLLPRCRGCGNYTLGPVHKVALLLAAGALLAALIASYLTK